MAETTAIVATSTPAKPMGQTAIETTTIAPPVPITTARAITEGEPKVETTKIAMSDTAETMIGSTTIPASLRKGPEPKVVVTTFPKQDAEENRGGTGQ